MVEKYSTKDRESRRTTTRDLRTGYRGLESKATGDDEWDGDLDLNNGVRWSSISDLRVEDDRPWDVVAGGLEVLSTVFILIPKIALTTIRALEDGNVTLGLLRKELRCID